MTERLGGFVIVIIARKKNAERLVRIWILRLKRDRTFSLSDRFGCRCEMRKEL